MMEEEEKYVTSKEAMLPKSDDELPIDVRFRHMTKGLFYEYRHQTTTDLVAPYTTKPYDFTDKDGTVYKSMYIIYMHCDSEYEAAIQLLGSYNHWKKLAKTNWFSVLLEEWEHERNIRDEAIARKTLVRAAEAGNVTAANAMYKTSKTTGKTAGRPTRGGKRGKLHTDSAVNQMLDRISGDE